MEPSSCAVSGYETGNGLPRPRRGTPPLVYRTRPDNYSCCQSKEDYTHKHSNELYPVWSTSTLNIPCVRSQILNVINRRKIRYSFFHLVRHITFEEDGKETEGPVVVWIGVFPGSTSADAAKEASQDILKLLERNGVDGADVEWRESVAEPF
ncbi:hypothetical protein BDN70DRAFT_919673 [Pholiota conissans]|uniref:Uncharacterized protein n=1 Tax=Pholiota conissans TaxID=109636 RepID=A0A9P5Z5V8_9AGAR|nr:hypothetical protein BDN70DRAFT_919673 [Pholiota conissans]